MRVGVMELDKEVDFIFKEFRSHCMSGELVAEEFGSFL
jgi:hypothetical protein